ncbi:PREDICTED: uncharacterized protein LOC108556697 isoform X2 [Nicrophorus vespilloides]|uniref:Uncharacterized protein LOC108556697 isoform X2 n=1 Tax=Nicrophorus vespilloides TaxID=110193 RepID=A0ABM1M1E5_NICVS|nr:PREDICTED: uncharacterized protein LOC108556697 isoform X2 [Nicrophorus vespilloides]
MDGAMFQNATVSSRSSSSRGSGGNSCSRNSSMPSLRMRSPLSPKTSYNPLFRHSDALTSFDASHFIFQEKRKDKKDRKTAVLRRYNSHDSSANFSKDNTPDSTKSRDSRTTPDTSPESTGDRKLDLEARDFLERYSLPRVVRVAGSEPLLLYRCFDSFTKIEARAVYTKKGKEKTDTNVLHFPEGYNGWFSLINEKGDRCAVAYSSVLQLVREQVCSFISIQPFIAYAGHHSDPSDSTPPAKFQYLKTQVKGGQLFQLRAVFQHRDHDGGRMSTKTVKLSKSTREKDLGNRYAQLISQTNQEFYVPLTTKGEFYEIHSSVKAKLCFPGMLDKTGPLALDKDCLYKITHLLRRVALPIKVKLLAGPLPTGLPKDFAADTFILEKKFQEPLMVTCTLPAPSETAKHEISCINLNSGVKISRCMLGFDSENRLFKSQRLQAALAFCHKNVESWYREVRLAPNLEVCYECRSCKGSNCKKGSCENLVEEETKQLITKEVLEKFPKSKKWYKHFKILGVGAEDKFENLKDPIDGMEKVKSIERYKDMSKLIEDKFGKKSYNPVKKSASFMFSTKRIDLEETPTQTKNNPALLKCQSLDTQLFSIEESSQPPTQWHTAKSNISDSLSYDFQMCILDNETTSIEKPKKKQPLKIDLDEIRPATEDVKLKKTKPDLIPTLTKDDSSFMTDRLCSEFHVKTKVQKRSISKHSMLTNNLEKNRGSMRVAESTSLSIFDIQMAQEKKPNVKSVVVQIHENSLSKTKMQLRKKILDEDIPYSHVADEVCAKPSGKHENIYAEICEQDAKCKCDNGSICKCRHKPHSEYCYVKLGSNGDSVTSDSDEAIYNTLR